MISSKCWKQVKCQEFCIWQKKYPSEKKENRTFLVEQKQRNLSPGNTNGTSSCKKKKRIPDTAWICTRK